MRKRITDQYKTAAQVVLNVRSGKARSRRDLATLMELSPSTVGLYVDQMIRGGFLEESGREQGSMGRPKRNLATCESAGWFVGVEFHASRVRGVRVNFAGVLKGTVERALKPGDGAEEVVSAISEIVEKLRKGAGGPLLGLGVGAPGVVDPATGEVGQYAFLRQWDAVPLGCLMVNRLGVPVAVEGNIRAIALGERWFGGGKQISHYVILGPRTGFGVAVVHGGELFNGLHHAAGEVGNWRWQQDGHDAELHAVLSAPAVWRRLTGATAETVLPADLHAALGDWQGRSDVAVWKEVQRDFAKVIGQMELLLDCKNYFVHGPLTSLGEAFWTGVEKQVMEWTPHLEKRRLMVRCSELGEDAGPLGAASLAMEKWVPIW
jgi:predicted NBD/HSP70 family sugar kinase